MHAHQVWWAGLSGFGDFVPFCLPSKIPFGPRTVVHKIKKRISSFPEAEKMNIKQQ